MQLAFPLSTSFYFLVLLCLLIQTRIRSGLSRVIGKQRVHKTVFQLRAGHLFHCSQDSGNEANKPINSKNSSLLISGSPSHLSELDGVYQQTGTQPHCQSLQYCSMQLMSCIL
jgi:hypothetical protein